MAARPEVHHSSCRCRLRVAGAGDAEQPGAPAACPSVCSPGPPSTAVVRTSSPYVCPTAWLFLRSCYLSRPVAYEQTSQAGALTEAWVCVLARRLYALTLCMPRDTRHTPLLASPNTVVSIDASTLTLRPYLLSPALLFGPYTAPPTWLPLPPIPIPCLRSRRGLISCAPAAANGSARGR